MSNLKKKNYRQIDYKVSTEYIMENYIIDFLDHSFIFINGSSILLNKIH